MPATLVTGATGFLGSHLTRLLVARGDREGSSTVLVQRFLRRQIPAYVDGTLNIVGVDDVEPVALRLAGGVVRRSPLGWR